MDGRSVREVGSRIVGWSIDSCLRLGIQWLLDGEGYSWIQVPLRSGAYAGAVRTKANTLFLASLVPGAAYCSRMDDRYTRRLVS